MMNEEALTFLTNREWMNTLTDEQLSQFLTDGLLLHHKLFDAIGNMYTTDFVTSISSVYRRYIDSPKGLEKWLSEPQEFDVVSWSALK